MLQEWKAAATIYGWDCPLTYTYPGFDCGSIDSQRQEMRQEIHSTAQAQTNCNKIAAILQQFQNQYVAVLDEHKAILKQYENKTGTKQYLLRDCSSRPNSVPKCVVGFFPVDPFWGAPLPSTPPHYPFGFASSKASKTPHVETKRSKPFFGGMKETSLASSAPEMAPCGPWAACWPPEAVICAGLEMFHARGVLVQAWTRTLAVRKWDIHAPNEPTLRGMHWHESLRPKPTRLLLTLNPSSPTEQPRNPSRPQSPQLRSCACRQSAGNTSRLACNVQNRPLNHAPCHFTPQFRKCPFLCCKQYQKEARFRTKDWHPRFAPRNDPTCGCYMHRAHPPGLMRDMVTSRSRKARVNLLPFRAFEVG